MVEIIAESSSRDARGQGIWAGGAEGNNEEASFGGRNSRAEEKRELGSRTPDRAEGGTRRYQKREKMFTREASTGVLKGANGGARGGY
jgi:hypothetical protein